MTSHDLLILGMVDTWDMGIMWYLGLWHHDAITHDVATGC